MVKLHGLILYLGLCIASSNGRLEGNLLQGIVKVLKTIPRPSQISTIFCGNVENELELIKRLSTPTDLDPIPISRLRSQPEYFRHLFILEIGSCSPAYLTSLFDSNQRGLANSQWLIVNSLTPFGIVNQNQIRDTFLNVNISQMSEIMFLTMDEEKLKIMTVYKMERVYGNEVIVEEMGFFANNSSLQFIDTRPHKVTSMRRKNMHGAKLPLAAVLTKPKSIDLLFEFEDMEVDTVGKTGHRLGVVVLQFVHAVPELVVSNSWGALNTTTGKWTGMMGDLISGAAELAGTASFIRPERAQVVEYISISLDTEVKIVFRAPKLSYTTNVYLLPFERGLWVAVFVIFCAITLLLLAAARGEWKLAGAGTDEHKPRFIDILFVIFSAICNQGSSFNLHSIGGRIVFFSYLVLVVCLFVSYCAFIVVLLQSPATNIRTAQDLLNSRMQIGAEDTVYNRFWLKVVY